MKLKSGSNKGLRRAEHLVRCAHNQERRKGQGYVSQAGTLETGSFPTFFADLI